LHQNSQPELIKNHLPSLRPSTSLLSITALSALIFLLTLEPMALLIVCHGPKNSSSYCRDVRSPSIAIYCIYRKNNQCDSATNRTFSMPAQTLSSKAGDV